MNNEIMKKLKELASKYDPEFEAGEYWDSGNMDDAFNSGLREGQNSVLKELSDILEGIQ